MIYLILALLWALLVAVFAVQNAGPVEISFLSWQMTTSVALLAIGATIAGAVFLGLIGLFRQVGLGLKLWDEKARTQKATAELEQARLASASLKKDVEKLEEHNRRLLSRIDELQAELAESRAPSPAAAGGDAVAVAPAPAEAVPLTGPQVRPPCTPEVDRQGEGGPDDRKPEQ